jgi:glycosyltransferase involved in cell wall biosynthesis
MSDIKISAVIIAKNEEKKIGNCLKSLTGWADEIIVVDGISTDKTVEICNYFCAKVVPHQFTGAFADDRNLGNDKARNDWVLQLDADDIVTDDFKSKADEAIARDTGTDIVVYKFRRKNFFLGHPMDHGGFHHFIPNLINRKHVKYEGVVHEVPVYKGLMGTIDADIEHYPFDNIGQFVNRQNRYTDIASSELVKTEGVLPEKEIKKNMIGKSLKMFYKSYVKKQGYKEGFYGLVFAILFAFINFLKWAKYRELCYGKLANK